MTNETNITSAPKKLKQIDMTQAVMSFLRTILIFLVVLAEVSFGGHI